MSLVVSEYVPATVCPFCGLCGRMLYAELIPRGMRLNGHGRLVCYPFHTALLTSVRSLLGRLPDS